MATEDHIASARAVFDASVDRYVAFVGDAIGPPAEHPSDRALLTAFAEELGASPTGLVADVGCGPGRVAALLADHGLQVIGFDVSEEMVAAARSTHPSIAFAPGRLDDLPLDDGALAGAVCWYSIIYTPPTLLDRAFAELERVLAPAARLLLAFQVGDGEGVHRLDAQGTGLPLTSYRHGIDDVAQRLEASGFDLVSTTSREAALDHEVTPQGFVLARRR